MQRVDHANICHMVRPCMVVYTLVAQLTASPWAILIACAATIVGACVFPSSDHWCVLQVLPNEEEWWQAVMANCHHHLFVN